jgi:hypothetical protein
MNDASASGLLRKYCCGDKGIAEATITFASRGPSTLLYDLCSSAVVSMKSGNERGVIDIRN